MSKNKKENLETTKIENLRIEIQKGIDGGDSSRNVKDIIEDAKKQHDDKNS